MTSRRSLSPKTLVKEGLGAGYKRMSAIHTKPIQHTLLIKAVSRFVTIGNVRPKAYLGKRTSSEKPPHPHLSLRYPFPNLQTYPLTLKSDCGMPRGGRCDGYDQTLYWPSRQYRHCQQAGRVLGSLQVVSGYLLVLQLSCTEIVAVVLNILQVAF
ncbi:hypothetical protein CVT26_006272 [Gymnopilus dilepis]|uniref:Uncharacterized protein n=1 Tax=Gymnopilus dilepis TaxID=231916 RepID=A0A409Y1E7_9AGAR|nr:hypothetical protein CVT26_006272 [Gymnopilus dilepis]